MNTRRGFSVNVFLPTGDPEGLKVVEKSNWSGWVSITFDEAVE